MKTILKILLEKWKAFARKLAVVQTTIILFVLYFGLFSIMALLTAIARQDILDKRLVPVKSYWKKRESLKPFKDQFKHQF